MNEKAFWWVFGTLIALFIVINIVGGIIYSIQMSNADKKRCLDYCNCSITQDCPYTFDYDEVKGCDCNE